MEFAGPLGEMRTLSGATSPARADARAEARAEARVEVMIEVMIEVSGGVSGGVSLLVGSAAQVRKGGADSVRFWPKCVQK